MKNTALGSRAIPGWPRLEKSKQARATKQRRPCPGANVCIVGLIARRVAWAAGGLGSPELGGPVVCLEQCRARRAWCPQRAELAGLHKGPWWGGGPEGQQWWINRPTEPSPSLSLSPTSTYGIGTPWGLESVNIKQVFLVQDVSPSLWCPCYLPAKGKGDCKGRQTEPRSAPHLPG